MSKVKITVTVETELPEGLTLGEFINDLKSDDELRETTVAQGNLIDVTGEMIDDEDGDEDGKQAA